MVKLQVMVEKRVKPVKPMSERRSTCPDAWVAAGARVPLRLTVQQDRYCRRAMGVSRFCYNLAVATHRFCRTNRLPWPSWQDIYKEFNACKREDYPFAAEVSARVAEGSFMDFGRAVANWRNGSTRGRAPVFKKRRLTGSGSFRAASGVAQLKYNGKRRIRLPYLGSVKLAHTLPEGIFHEAHIKRENGRWYLCLKMWQEPKGRPAPDRRGVGAVDTGINPLGTDSEGETYENPRATYQVERKLRRWQRTQARRRIDWCHRRIRGLRSNAQHQMTSRVIGKFHTLVIEDLNVAGMMGGPTPRAQGDAGMGELRRQLVYKGAWRHTDVKLAHRWYPSSKTCSNCKPSTRNSSGNGSGIAGTAERGTTGTSMRRLI